MTKKKIRVAIIGVGNCAKSLVEGIAQADDHKKMGIEVPGIGFQNIGGYGPADMEVVLAYDIDRRKVGKALEQAIYADPNCAFDIEHTRYGMYAAGGDIIVQTRHQLLTTGSTACCTRRSHRVIVMSSIVGRCLGS